MLWNQKKGAGKRVRITKLCWLIDYMWECETLRSPPPKKNVNLGLQFMDGVIPCKKCHWKWAQVNSENEILHNGTLEWWIQKSNVSGLPAVFSSSVKWLGTQSFLQRGKHRIFLRKCWVNHQLDCACCASLSNYLSQSFPIWFSTKWELVRQLNPTLY